ncbi:SET-domain-containing protein [Mycena venus]|uniref:SET-domain-containing protein n=1 Tax=Mycena venus TaxID=2733690 RepID=A0A8H6WYN5_9AGAR|nr:SET-domain-containing protein [Mycena venus]
MLAGALPAGIRITLKDTNIASTIIPTVTWSPRLHCQLGPIPLNSLGSPSFQAPASPAPHVSSGGRQRQLCLRITSNPVLCRHHLDAACTFFGPSTVAGTGVFAQEDIECGETVIIERPFVMAVASVPEKNLPDLSPLQSMAFEAMDFFVAERLSTSDRRDFFSHVSSDNSPYQIMSQNSIPVSESLPGPYSGPHSIICRDISRINHSCTPNVDLTWDPSSFSVSIHSSSRISKGEELLRSYGDFLLPRSNRMEWMSNVYDFKCTCPSCSLPDKESHKSDVIRRFLMKDLSKIIRTVSSDEGGEMVDLDFDAWLSDPSLPDDYFTSRCENVLGLMHRDGATNLGLCAIYYTRLMRAYVVLADEEKARHWASKAMDIMHPVFAEVREYASGILARQRDEEWGIRKRLS